MWIPWPCSGVGRVEGSCAGPGAAVHNPRVTSEMFRAANKVRLFEHPSELHVTFLGFCHFINTGRPGADELSAAGFSPPGDRGCPG